MDDLISRQAAIDAVSEGCQEWRGIFERCKENLLALPSAQPERRWIPVKTRPMDEEEKQYYEEHYGYKVGVDYDGFMFDCPMPYDGQEVWVYFKSGNVEQDTCVVDEGIGLEGNGDWDDIVAWMPFNRPKPWRGEEWMWEDLYQVYMRYGDGEYDLRASDMTINDAVLFVKAVFAESFNEDPLRLEIRRQPMDYGKSGRGEANENTDKQKI